MTSLNDTFPFLPEGYHFAHTDKWHPFREITVGTFVNIAYRNDEQPRLLIQRVRYNTAGENFLISEKALCLVVYKDLVKVLLLLPSGELHPEDLTDMHGGGPYYRHVRLP